MSGIYDGISVKNKGAWIVHHSQKTSATVNGAAEFPAFDAAGKASALLSQLAESEQCTIEKLRVDALAKAAGLNPLTELGALLDILSAQRLIDKSAAGDVAVLGLTTNATVQHAAAIFEQQQPTTEERASIALAELTSDEPIPFSMAQEKISDEFQLPSTATQDFLARSETVGFVDAEGGGSDKLFFNGNLFRRDNLTKVTRVLSSLSSADQARTAQFDEYLKGKGCVPIAEADRQLGADLFGKLRSAGMYDINHISNPSGDHGFVTRPAAFNKFNDPLVDDAFDLAKALVAALTYGMTLSGSGRGQIQMISALLQKLISGRSVGPATAIGEDYRVLETKGVVRVTRAFGSRFQMRLLKKDIGQMALAVLTTGEAATENAAHRLLPGRMEGYSGPETTRSSFRQKQVPSSKKLTYDVLSVLRTEGGF